ncbi:Uncharacterized protein T4D_14635 [Trichinella pseudospiralis]|uniref:Uncharacterized protein n=1 Tax=Trichinella pseudospiralis TaxID=6337 RepID=A0A0V1G5W2_TRIPS|nr:Uncharacterized protein T4D_14635 [Trichinella pseudospiralis]
MIVALVGSVRFSDGHLNNSTLLLQVDQNFLSNSTENELLQYKAELTAALVQVRQKIEEMEKSGVVVMVNPPATALNDSRVEVVNNANWTVVTDDDNDKELYHNVTDEMPTPQPAGLVQTFTVSTQILVRDLSNRRKMDRVMLKDFDDTANSNATMDTKIADSIINNTTIATVENIENDTVILENITMNNNSESGINLFNESNVNHENVFTSIRNHLNATDLLLQKQQHVLDKFLQNMTNCVQFTKDQLIDELKHRGTYNPDFMAWDVRGVLKFFEKFKENFYDSREEIEQHTVGVEQNLAALEGFVRELELQNCNLRTPDVFAKLYNITMGGMKSSPMVDHSRARRQLLNTNRQAKTGFFRRTKLKYLAQLYKSPRLHDSPSSKLEKRLTSSSNKHIGELHIVPFGCKKRGSSESGFLRLCSSCQAIRRLPDNYFPPFINEVTCDEDKSCLHFSNQLNQSTISNFSAHGSCKQRYLNFDLLKNVGTTECQIWKKVSLNVRVSCECFLDQMSFFAKYV